MAAGKDSEGREGRVEKLRLSMVVGAPTWISASSKVRMAVILFRRPIHLFPGGAGGEGGTGNKQAGAGGGGGGAEIEREEEPLLSQTRLPGPNMNIEGFGAKYHLSDTTVAQLSNFGYDTAGSVRFATAADLKADGFKQGQINQLKHALDIWSPKT